MNLRSLQSGIIVIAVSLLLGACGKGGSNAGDTYPDGPVTAAAVTGPNSFLLFPNSIKQADGSYQVNTLAYAQAYYKAIDPNNDKDTYDKWRAANHFAPNSPTNSSIIDASGSQYTVTVGDKRDLGYGRYITARKNTDGTIAISVKNYLIPAAAGYGYSTLNMDAAVARDDRWYIGASNLEFSPGPGCTATSLPDSARECTYFAKFYFFAPDGSRVLMVNLDGRGAKAMPGPCISCHGGRADPLTAADAQGVKLFPLVQNSASLTRGDVQGHPHPLEPDSFDFSAQPGFTRAEQESAIKQINIWILGTYPLPFGTTIPTGFPEDVGRRVANQYEWQGTGADLIKGSYGGDGLPNGIFADTTPPSWSSAGQTSLFQNVFVPSCRVCHILRGMGKPADGQGSDIDLTTYAKFNGYADQIKSHVIDEGNMPLAKILYEKFWSTSTIFGELAAYLENAGYTVRDGAGAVLVPGRPVADAGPNRIVKGATVLSAAASKYATSYSWSIVTDPVGGATLTNPTLATPTFTPAGNGSYVLKLVVGKDGVLSPASQVTIVVDSSLSPTPASITFATDIKPVIQTLSTCANLCHKTTSLTAVAQAPVAYNNFDRNGDGSTDATDDAWLKADICGRINFDDIGDSPLLLKPSGHHHGGSLLAGFDSTLTPGATTGGTGNLGRRYYDLFLNWILNAAPQECAQ